MSNEITFHRIDEVKLASLDLFGASAPSGYISLTVHSEDRGDFEVTLFTQDLDILINSLRWAANYADQKLASVERKLANIAKENENE